MVLKNNNLVVLSYGYMYIKYNKIIIIYLLKIQVSMGIAENRKHSLDMTNVIYLPKMALLCKK